MTYSVRKNQIFAVWINLKKQIMQILIFEFQLNSRSNKAICISSFIEKSNNAKFQNKPWKT